MRIPLRHGSRVLAVPAAPVTADERRSEFLELRAGPRSALVVVPSAFTGDNVNAYSPNVAARLSKPMTCSIFREVMATVVDDRTFVEVP